MKGVILAGGTGSRLSPLTRVTNKHLLPVGKVPMIYWPVARLVEAGIKEIMVVTGKEHMGDIVELLGSGSEFSSEFTYRVQDEAGGIAQALSLVETFAAGGKIVVILGDNIFGDEITADVNVFKKQKKGARIMLKEVDDPQRYGVAEVEGEWGNMTVKAIEEKPEEPKSDYAVTGIYFYDPQVFKIISTLKPSGRGELEITDVNNMYIKKKTMTCGFLMGWWTDAGTFDSYAHANQVANEITLPTTLAKFRRV